MICGYKWQAPLLKSGSDIEMRTQVCQLEKGHDGDHKSITNVIAPNKKES